jgi:hypothetical protein
MVERVFRSTHSMVSESRSGIGPTK